MIRWGNIVKLECGEWQIRTAHTLAGNLDLTLPMVFEWTAELTHVIQLAMLKHTRIEINLELQRKKVECDVQQYIYHNYKF